jgi:pimeloyl-ACP methyl ester carboxylesterase
MPSQSDPTNIHEFDIIYTATGTTPGDRTVTCTVQGHSAAPVPPAAGVSVFDATVYDATPQIETVALTDPSTGTYTITGTSFGAWGTGDSVIVCALASSTTPCNQTADITFGSVIWAGTTLSVVLIPSATASGPYCVQVQSGGASGSHFNPAPNNQSNTRSQCATIPSYTISGTVTTSDGTGISGITVDQQMNIRTDANGHYSVRVAAGASYTVAPNDLSGTYWFNPRNVSFTNINSNKSANFTATPVTYIYLIHGIGQTATAMANLKANLEDPSVGVDPARYHIDAGFTFGCATTCGGPCSVQPGQTLVNLGAQWLGSYIQIQQPPGNIILIGYSMGGLIARDLIANNYGGALTGHPVTALITLGTPNLGYPYASIDENIFCRQLVLDMSGSWGQTSSGWNELTSPYLDGLRQMWATRSYTVPWMAAAGESCPNMTRNLPLRSTVGCPSWSPTSDGVVCRDSAQYGGPVSGYGYFNDGPKPFVPWVDTAGIYVHTNSFAGWGTAGILCGNSGNPSVNPQMFDPPNYRDLFPQIKAVISAH